VGPGFKREDKGEEEEKGLPAENQKRRVNRKRTHQAKSSIGRRSDVASSSAAHTRAETKTLSGRASHAEKVNG